MVMAQYMDSMDPESNVDMELMMYADDSSMIEHHSCGRLGGE